MLVPHTGELAPSIMNRRQRANIPALLRQADPERFPPVYVFNVFNREHQIHFGSKGLKTIPACPAGRSFGPPLVFKAIEIEEYDLADGQGNMSFTAEEGMTVARDVIGVNSTYAQLGLYTTNLEHWGVFVTDRLDKCRECDGSGKVGKSDKACAECFGMGGVPSSKELAAANAKLTKLMRVIFANGKALAAKGPMGLDQIQENHNLAAAFLGEQTPWATAPQVARTACPHCAEAILPAAKKCIHCGEWLDGREKEEKKAASRN